MPEDEYDFDPWEGSTGLPDKLTVRVTEPYFGYDALLQDGKQCAFFLKGQVIAGADEAEFSQWYTVGKDVFEPASKGQRLVPADGKHRKINTQTNYYALFHSLQEAAEKQDLMDDLRKRGTPFDTALWQDLELYLERIHGVRTINGERQEWNRLQVASIEKIPGSGARERFRSAPEEQAAGEAEPDGADLSPRLKVAIKKLAAKVKGEGGTHSQFAEAAFSDIDGVLDNAAAEDAVMDQGADSIWGSS